MIKWTWVSAVLAALVMGCSGSNGGPTTPGARGDRVVPHTSDGNTSPTNNSPPIVGEKTHLKGGLGGKR